MSYCTHFETIQIRNYATVIKNQDFQPKRIEINYKIKEGKLSAINLDLNWKEWFDLMIYCHLLKLIYFLARSSEEA